jgi:hypothetical protein
MRSWTMLNAGAGCQRVAFFVMGAGRLGHGEACHSSLLRVVGGVIDVIGAHHRNGGDVRRLESDWRVQPDRSFGLPHVS